MWLIAVWATLRWLDRGRHAYLLAVSATLAWGFAARPLTMVVLSVPVMVVILRRILATRQWWELAAPAMLGVAILMILPVWNHLTLGDWRRDPYPQYSRVYFPFDKPGFGVDPMPPLRSLVRDRGGLGNGRAICMRYTLRSSAAGIHRAPGRDSHLVFGWLASGARRVDPRRRAPCVWRGPRRRDDRRPAGARVSRLRASADLDRLLLRSAADLHFLAAREIGRLVAKAAGPGNEAAWANAMMMVAGAASAWRERRPPGPCLRRRQKRIQSLSRRAVLAGLPPGKRSYSSAIPRLRIRTWH